MSHLGVHRSRIQAEEVEQSGGQQKAERQQTQQHPKAEGLSHSWTISPFVIVNQYLVAANQYATWPSDRKSTRLNSSHVAISYAVFCLKKKRLMVKSHRDSDA